MKPPRYSGGQGTQVKDKGWQDFIFRGIEFPEEKGGKLRVRIIYKHYPTATDDEGLLLYDKFYELPALKKREKSED